MNACTPIEIRTATLGDMPLLGKFGAALVALHHEWDPHRFIASGSKTPAAYSGWLERQLGNAEVVILVAEVEGIVIAYAYAGLEGYDYMALRGPAGVVYDVFVQPDRRKSGVGRALLLAAIRGLEACGATQVVLSTAHRNAEAQRLFAAIGFRPTMIEMALTIKYRADRTE